MGAIPQGLAAGSALFNTIGGISNATNARKQLTGYRDASQGLTEQANANYYNLLFPQQQYMQQQLWNSGGYTPSEQAQMYLTPDEQAAQYYTPAEQRAMQITAPEAVGIRDLALSPISGAATRAQQQLRMGAAARGGYAPGSNAAAEEVQREQGRQAGETALGTNLGIASYNRDAAARIAAQRAQVAANKGYFRTGQAGQIGQARMAQQNLGAGLTAQQSALESQRQLYGLNQWGNAARGLAQVPTTTGALAGGIGQGIAAVAKARSGGGN